ncbi:hypothetical protein CEP54_006122 [Fusarium duplospermum]|uniref:Uncharacterized protein n=1 Tax=Fusarium duplospermum TaxID=1325734 RepID=A0A428Q8Y3_9HYPO|nr:hypothetical protein CEP54_006122 [Fusarium duplospermum]
MRFTRTTVSINNTAALDTSGKRVKKNKAGRQRQLAKAINAQTEAQREFKLALRKAEIHTAQTHIIYTAIIASTACSPDFFNCTKCSYHHEPSRHHAPITSNSEKSKYLRNVISPRRRSNEEEGAVSLPAGTLGCQVSRLAS